MNIFVVNTVLGSKSGGPKKVTNIQIVANRGMEFVGRITHTAMRCWQLGHSMAFIPADPHQSNKMAKIAGWIRGKLILRQAEYTRQVARYYKQKNVLLEPGSLVWLNRRTTNKVAQKFALQWA